MKVYFWRSNKERVLRCRRGKNYYRPLEIPANTDVCIYEPLTNSILELSEQGIVIGTAEIETAIAPTVQLQTTNNLEKLVEADNVESSSEESVDDQVVNESSPENETELQRMGEESADNATALSGAVEVQVSSVVGGDDGLNSGSERGSESGPDGVYSDDYGMDVSQDRSGQEVDSVSSSDEDSSGD